MIKKILYLIVCKLVFTVGKFIDELLIVLIHIQNYFYKERERGGEGELPHKKSNKNKLNQQVT